MDNSQKSYKSKSNDKRTKDLSADLRTYKNRETCSMRTPVSDTQFSLHQGCPFYRGLSVLPSVLHALIPNMLNRLSISWLQINVSLGFGSNISCTDGNLV